MKLRVSIAVAVLLAFGVAYGAQQQPPEADRYRLMSTTQEIMDAMIDPSADYLWSVVSVTISAAGPVEKVPRNDEDWKNARQRAVTLIEAANLLLIPGRQLAKPGTKSQNPGIEAEPAEIEKLIAENPTAWIDLTRGMQDAAALMLAAIDARNAAKLADLGGNLDHACESCHLKFWYPNEAKQDSPGPVR